MSHQTVLLQDDEDVIPLGFQVLLRVSDEERKTVGGIVLASGLEATKEKKASMRGTVVDVGPLAGQDVGDSPENWGAVKGTEVSFNAYEGTHYQRTDGTFLICLPEKEIISKIVKKQAKE